MRPGPITPPQAAALAAEVTGLLGVLRGRAQREMPPGPVSPSQFRALIAIGRLEGGNLRALGDALGSSPPATSRLCDRLEAAGLVERRSSAVSRREVELHLSRQGRALLDEAQTREAEEMRPVLEAMAPEALRQLAEGLAAFRDAAAAVVDGALGGEEPALTEAVGGTGFADQDPLRMPRPA